PGPDLAGRHRDAHHHRRPDQEPLLGHHLHPQQPSRALNTAVFADALLDPATGELVRNAVVLAEEGRILAAGSRDTVSVPAGATRIDAEGLVLLPGLVDCHVHLVTPGDGLDLGQ